MASRLQIPVVPGARLEGLTACFINEVEYGQAWTRDSFIRRSTAAERRQLWRLTRKEVKMLYNNWARSGRLWHNHCRSPKGYQAS